MVVVLGTIMAILDTTIVAVALATLARDFHTSINTIQWVTTGYLLALAVVIPLSGWAVHRFGAKPVYIISLLLFIAGSALCGVARSADALIAFRVLQGLGGGMIMPVGQTIMARTAGPDKMNKVMAVIGVPTLLGPILGPVHRGDHRLQLLVAVDLLRQRPDRHRRADPVLPLPAHHAQRPIAPVRPGRVPPAGAWSCPAGLRSVRGGQRRRILLPQRSDQSAGGAWP